MAVLTHLKVLAVRACWVGAAVATRVDPFPHVTEGRVIVAVGAEDITLALGSGSEVQDLESVKGTLKRQTVFKCFTLTRNSYLLNILS